MALTGREKAIIFLSLLGADTSARLLRYLPPELADLVATGVNHLPKPSPQAVNEVINELKGFLSLPPANNPRPPVGQPRPTAASAQASTLETVVPPITPVPPPPAPPPPPEKPKTPEEKFEQASARKLASILLYERPQIIAFALLLMSGEKQLEILSSLPGQRPLVESLLRDYRQNGFTGGIKGKIITYLAEKL